MTLTSERPQGTIEHEPEHHGPTGILKWLTSTDHKVIGLSYLVTSFVAFAIAGVLAMVMRTQLTGVDSTIVSQHTYNELFTMHGSLMIYLFAGPFAFGGLANYIVPLQVGAPDMAFPRLNALSYWLYLSGSLTMLAGAFTVGGAADFGWVAYAPLSDSVNSPGAGPDMWIVALILTGFSAIFTGVNIVTTVFYLRAPGMTMFRVPIFTWNMLVTGILILIAFPVLTAALILLWCDRHLGTHIYSVAGGGVPVLWQNLFWFWGHPEVYILALPFFGIVTEVIPVFSRKPLFGYRGMIFATISIAALSTAVWAHHMFTTGTVLLPFFSLMSYLTAIPTGIKFFNWIGTMWRGSVKFDTPMLFAVGFLVIFLFGGVTGIFLASPPIDFATHDTYFIVAHFHEVLFGSAVFGGFSGVYFWYPKMTGRMMRESLGKASFWFMFVGFWVTFMPQYLLGLHGMPRRIADYANESWVNLNRISTAGAYLLFIAVAIMFVNFYVSWRRPVIASGNPWDANALEWATSSPPPHHNFNSIPPIRSERPVWDANHPDHLALGHVHKPYPVEVETAEVLPVKHEAYFLLFLAAFGAVITVIYGLLSSEWAGTVMLTGFFLLSVFPGGYYYWWSRRMTPRAEDNPKAELSDGVGVVGSFPSTSIWPFVLGLGVALVGLALVFGFWTTLVGFFLVISAVIGVTIESRHGGLARR